MTVKLNKVQLSYYLFSRQSKKNDYLYLNYNDFCSFYIYCAENCHGLSKIEYYNSGLSTIQCQLHFTINGPEIITIVILDTDNLRTKVDTKQFIKSILLNTYDIQKFIKIINTINSTHNNKKERGKILQNVFKNENINLNQEKINEIIKKESKILIEKNVNLTNCFQIGILIILMLCCIFNYCF